MVTVIDSKTPFEIPMPRQHALSTAKLLAESNKKLQVVFKIIRKNIKNATLLLLDAFWMVPTGGEGKFTPECRLRVHVGRKEGVDFERCVRM